MTTLGRKSLAHYVFPHRSEGRGVLGSGQRGQHAYIAGLADAALYLDSASPFGRYFALENSMRSWTHG